MLFFTSITTELQEVPSQLYSVVWPRLALEKPHSFQIFIDNNGDLRIHKNNISCHIFYKKLQIMFTKAKKTRGHIKFLTQIFQLWCNGCLKPCRLMLLLFFSLSVFCFPPVPHAAALWAGVATWLLLQCQWYNGHLSVWTSGLAPTRADGAASVQPCNK